MNVLEELRSLDVNEPGRWPPAFRAAAVALLFVLVGAFGIWQFVVKVEIPALDRARQDEVGLRASFETKQSRAANFDAYRNQLAEIERDFGTMLRQLPGETEVANLLEDVSQSALAAGLEQDLFRPEGEIQRDFYAEYPVSLRYFGSFHEMGEFVSAVAALPRIVTLHNARIGRVSLQGGEVLELELTGKTYRYLDEEPEG